MARVQDPPITRPPVLTDTAGPLSSHSLRTRAAALVDILLAFALVHLCWRSFKHFTRLGQLESSSHQNYSAGLIMIAFTVLAIRLRGWQLSEFGLNLRNWRYNLNLGILWGVLSVMALLLILLCTGYRPQAHGSPKMPWKIAFVGCCVALTFSLLLLWIFGKRRRPVAAVSPGVSLPVLLVLLSLPLLAAFHFQRPVAPVVGVVGWMFIGAGFGEEIFFRGYVQTRLDLAFGKPIPFMGIRFGAGLIVSSILFGLVHALNTVDYFNGRFAFNWPLGLFECFDGAFFAVMREKTGSVFPGAVAHGLSDVLTLVPG